MVDSDNNPRVQLFDTEGNFITQFGQPGSGAGELDVPEHLNVNTQGKVYVVDRGDQTIKVFEQCPAPISSFKEPESEFATTRTGDQNFPLPPNATSSIDPLSKSQPSSDLSLPDLFSMSDLFNLQ